jgi:hypothetical protein
MYGGRRRHGTGHGAEPLAHCDCRVIQLVALLLTEKNYQLWPDIEADRRLYTALAEGDYAAWHRYTTDEIEDSGQHEVLNWFCLLGAMEQLGRKPDRATFIETWAFVSPVVFAYYLP